MIVGAEASLWIWFKRPEDAANAQLDVRPTKVNKHAHKFSDMPGAWYLWLYRAREDPANDGSDPIAVIMDIVDRNRSQLRRFIDLGYPAQVRMRWRLDNGEGGITIYGAYVKAIAESGLTLVLDVECAGRHVCEDDEVDCEAPA